MCIILHYLRTYQFLKCTCVDKLVAVLISLILKLSISSMEVYQQSSSYNSINDLLWIRDATLYSSIISGLGTVRNMSLDQHRLAGILNTKFSETE